jgi:hypothetical protein
VAIGSCGGGDGTTGGAGLLAGAWAGAAWALGLGFEPHAVAKSDGGRYEQARVVMLSAPRTFRTYADPKLQARALLRSPLNTTLPVDLSLVSCSRYRG